jgi:hypothetical protein
MQIRPHVGSTEFVGQPEQESNRLHDTTERPSECGSEETDLSSFRNCARYNVRQLCRTLVDMLLYSVRSISVTVQSRKAYVDMQA